MEFKEELRHKIELVDQHLGKYLQGYKNSSEPIGEAMEYSLFAGGKRIRPVLMMATYELFGRDVQSIMPFACALEMIHTYSLIHDDLPAMDNSDLRRGRPSSHVVYGEAVAVLAGDALLNTAFEVMLKSGTADPSLATQTAACIAEASGVFGMIGGQVMDVCMEGKKIDFDTLKQIHSKKTGALIRAAVLAGAILGGADARERESLTAFAENFGLAFQIRDDILDVEGSLDMLGKPTGNDAAGKKNTYVSLLGLEKAKDLLKLHTKQAKDSIAIFGCKAAFLIELTDYLAVREK